MLFTSALFAQVCLKAHCFCASGQHNRCLSELRFWNVAFSPFCFTSWEFFSHPYVAVSWCPIPDSTFQHRDKNKWVTESTQTCRNSVKSHWRLRIGPPAWCGLVSVMRTDTERLWRECVSGCYIEKHLNMSAQQGFLTYTLETLRQDGCPGTYMPTDSWHGLDSAWGVRVCFCVGLCE